MTRPSISSPERFDALRAEHPNLIINLYAMTPRGVVTLEIITPDGQRYAWAAETAAAAYALAFPEDAVIAAPVMAEMATDIFD